ncbi:MAG: UDP-N-acetylmuramate dehydrogenase [Treponemataceae bacterium]|nr:MAG: UDP-N-acetylmuramate dehydrogenase [Treponemataceae bacterium]
MKIIRNASLKDYSTFKIGGIIENVFFPASSAELLDALAICKKSGKTFFVAGGGSNIFFPDENLTDCALISTANLGGYTISAGDNGDGSGGGGGKMFTCGAGLAMNDAVDASLAAGLAGLEHFAGLPGSVGGAAFMNARCYEKQVSDVLHSIEYLDAAAPSGITETYTYNSADWAYKHSPFQNTRRIITSVTFALTATAVGDLQETKNTADFCRRDREQKRQFDFPSCGSVFKNNRDFGKPSGKIIDEAGLKGFAIGGAQIAPWHGNIIINTGSGEGSAKARDVLLLIEHVKKVVQQKYGYVLEPEIIYALRSVSVSAAVGMR